MFGIFRREKKSARELTSEKLIAMADANFVDAVRSVVCQSDPASRVMLLVAINVLPIFMRVTIDRPDKSLPKNLDEFIMFLSKEDKARTDVGDRRMLWFLQAAYVYRATQISEKRDDVLSSILDMWISLIESGKVINSCLKHNIIWTSSPRCSGRLTEAAIQLG